MGKCHQTCSSRLRADEKNFTLAQKVAEAELEAGQADRAMALVSKPVSDD